MESDAAQAGAAMAEHNATAGCAFVVVYFRAAEDEEYPMPIEQFAPELEKIISLSEPIQMLANGFGGAGASRRTGVVEGRRLSAVQ
jgi:hypothetical protein